MALPVAARGDVSLSAQFSDHMVLQRDRPVAVWGMAAPGEDVTVELKAPKVKPRRTTGGGDGKWHVTLPPALAGGPYTLAITGRNTITINDVLVGEVWLCSGQSNMEFTLDRATSATSASGASGATSPTGGVTEASAANDDALRMFTVQGALAREPARAVRGAWKSATPANAPKMSAVAYYFGKELRKRLGVPVGLINASMGWTPAESWVSREALGADPGLKKSIVDRWDFWRDRYPVAQKLYQERVAAWQAAATAAKAAGQPEPPAPKKPVSDEFAHRASCLFNGMIAPLIPYGMRGAIWWQGETNVERGYQYRTLFPTLIRDWRARWGQGDLPFLYVQLAAVGSWPMTPEDARWAEVREAQLMTAQRVSRTGMVVALDIGLRDDVHPPRKDVVGNRLALAAGAVAYGRKASYTGARFDRLKIEGNRAVLRFKNQQGGLATSDGKAPAGFIIAGVDRKFYAGDAVVKGSTITVTSAAVPNPVTVRYAWLDFPLANLVDGGGLPASPFRTDDWPGITLGYDKMLFDQGAGINDETLVMR